ncbi:MAG TPA: hypothetical protein VEF36_02380 [Roseiarcus sp.]|nr:hypothetical protein [Roseiarcus sp.]
MSEPVEPADDSEDGQHRVFVNLATAVAVLVLALAAFWLMKTLDERRKLENCLNSGRRDCLEWVEPAAAPARTP